MLTKLSQTAVDLPANMPQRLDSIHHIDVFWDRAFAHFGLALDGPASCNNAHNVNFSLAKVLANELDQSAQQQLLLKGNTWTCALLAFQPAA